METAVDMDMCAMFFGANSFKSMGKRTWEKDGVRVKVISNIKFLITSTGSHVKHEHIATLYIPKSDEDMYKMFREFIGMKI